MLMILTVFVVGYIVYTTKELRIIREKLKAINDKNFPKSNDCSDNHEEDKHNGD